MCLKWATTLPTINLSTDKRTTTIRRNTKKSIINCTFVTYFPIGATSICALIGKLVQGLTYVQSVLCLRYFMFHFNFLCLYMLLSLYLCLSIFGVFLSFSLSRCFIVSLTQPHLMCFHLCICLLLFCCCKKSKSNTKNPNNASHFHN